MAFAENKIDVLKKIKDSKSFEELEKLRLYYLGKKGLIPEALKGLGSLSIEEKKSKGQELNIIKKEIEEGIKNQRTEIENIEISNRINLESIDVTLPPNISEKGKIHPISQTIFNIIEIFGNLNYAVETGPDIETDFNNFTALNIPENHPARQMHDTFYILSNKDKNVLRTHTSPVQIRYLESNLPPVRIIAPGRVYRRDAVDATHSPVFNQVEVLCIDQDINFSHLRGTVLTFLKTFFGDIPVRFRASYFPFTEPSAEVDVQWKGKWLEVMGCGMVDPKVLEKCGIDSERWTGFAAGLGVERFCMVRHQIDDIRKFYTNDLRFLEQF